MAIAMLTAHEPNLQASQALVGTLTEQSLELSIEDEDEISDTNPLQIESGFTCNDEMVLLQTPQRVLKIE